MKFILNYNTIIITDSDSAPIRNIISILARDIKKSFNKTPLLCNKIRLKKDLELATEVYRIFVGEDIEIFASDDLGFIYGLLKISEEYLGILPFWFWLDQKIEKKDYVEIKRETLLSEPYAVKYRGWFFNDEVLFMTWKVNGDSLVPWRMAFEALLRCGGNMTIPGTDKLAHENRQLASDFGLWLTHHHAEPLGAKMFSRVYPEKDANYSEQSHLFHKLWEESVIEQKDKLVVWNLCFRGQGDSAFWNSDTTGKYDTKEKRGELITKIINKQADIVRKYVEKPIFCTNLYGEIMELYNDGFVQIDPQFIKVKADNGYGKMVTRRRENHNPRSPSLPVKDGGPQGIYYHVSFYDLQAANHITALPNTINFVDEELSKVLEHDGNDFWIINCSNIRPHIYHLDAISKKWRGDAITDEKHSKEFVQKYFGDKELISQCLNSMVTANLKFGVHEDERAGEQFYTENIRYMARAHLLQEFDGINNMNWLCNGNFHEQLKSFYNICQNGIERIKAHYDLCKMTSNSLTGSIKLKFDNYIFLQAKIHYYCALGSITFCNSVFKSMLSEYKEAFILAGDAAELFIKANTEMRTSEEGVWNGFYYNDCLADVKFTADVILKMRSFLREKGDSPQYHKWYRDEVYEPEDQNVILLMVTDNHMPDEKLYKVMKQNRNVKTKKQIPTSS